MDDSVALPGSSFQAGQTEANAKQDFEGVVKSDSSNGGLDLPAASMKILKGALDVQEKKMVHAMKAYEGISYFVDLNTIIDEQEIEKMRADRYSRKPVVAEVENGKNVVIGVLLIKSLVGAPMSHTLRKLFQMRRAKIKLPLYSGPDESLFESIGKFEGKKTHMCFVYEDNAQAS